MTEYCIPVGLVVLMLLECLVVPFDALLISSVDFNMICYLVGFF